MKNLIRKILKEELNHNIQIGDSITVISKKKIGPMRYDKGSPRIGVVFGKGDIIDNKATYLGDCDFDGVKFLSFNQERCFDYDEVEMIKN